MDNTKRKTWSQLRIQQRQMSKDLLYVTYELEQRHAHHTRTSSATPDENRQIHENGFKRLLH